MDLNQGPKPSVTDINGVRYIDPNPTDQIVNHEDLVVYVKLVAKSKGRSILTNTEDETIIIEKELKNVGENTNFTYTEGKNYIDTDWTNIGGGPSPLGTDLGGFGMTNINIDFKSSFMPQIIIDFVDIRGAALFEQGPCSPYAMFFHLPYPVFELTVKGYYGKPVTYSLALTKFNTKFNAETGNFESKGEFVGYTYAFLADIPMGYILAANYMEDGPQILKEKWGKIANREEFTDSVYGLPEQPITIFDLVVKAKKLETQLPKLKNTTDIQEVAKISKVRKALIDLKEKVLDYAREVGVEVKNKRPNGGVRKNDTADDDSPATLYYFRIQKDATNSITLLNINKINKNYITTDNTEEGFGGGQIAIELALTKATYDTAGLNDPPDLNLELIKSNSSGFFGTPLVENPSYPDFDEYYVDISSFLKVIDVKLTSVNVQYKEKRKEVQKLLNDAVREILEFWPSIRNVFAIILTNTEVFLELMARTSVRAEEYHTQVDIRGGLGGSRNVVDLNQDLGSSGGESENFTYPWPTYYETLQKTATNVGDSGEKETYPGENEQFVAWPEVIFCEDFVQALTKLRRDLEVLEIEDTDNQPGFDNYAPITAFETQAFDNPKAPNRWFASDRGVPGSTELINSIYTIMGENAFILGDYSMINTLSLWKSQLGITNGYGWEPLSNGEGNSNGFSNSVIDGVGPINQGPQKFAENPFINENISNNNNLGRYLGRGWADAVGGLGFESRSTDTFKGTNNYEGGEGLYSFTKKVNPTTKAKMRHWGRIDAINLLQTIGSDGQTELLNIIKASINPSGQITASQLKDRIKESLKEVYISKFKEESFNVWADSASAAINNGIAKPKLITEQNIWDSHFSYVKTKPVLTLTGPIELNHLETIDGDISANPWNNPFQGVRLANKDQKKNGRTIEINDEEVVEVVNNLFKKEYNSKQDKDDKAESASGGGNKSISTAAIWGKPKFSRNIKKQYYSPYQRYDSKSTPGSFLDVSTDRASLSLDDDLNMLSMGVKDYRTNFYHTYADAKGLTNDNGIIWDLGSSRQIYTLDTTFIRPGSIKDGVGKMYTDFIATAANNSKGAADAMVQTPLWTLNYPPHKLPNLATYSWIAGGEIVNTNTNLAIRNPTGSPSAINVDSPLNQYRNFATWWGLNSYYGADGNTQDLISDKYHLPLAYLAVMSLGFDPPRMTQDSANNKTGHHIPYDGDAFFQENSFTNFTNQHVVVQPPKSWLLLLGAILWRAKEGHLLDTSFDGNIEPEYKFKGWNHQGISRLGLNKDTNCDNCMDDTSDPVYFFHNSISKPLRAGGTIPAIASITDNEWYDDKYIRRWRGYDSNGIDRWTASGGEYFLRPILPQVTPTNYYIQVNSNLDAVNQNEADRWGMGIGGNASTTLEYGFPSQVGKVLSYGNGAQGSKGWTKSSGWPLDTGHYKYGGDKFRLSNNINKGLFDQCRQDQMPFIISAKDGKNTFNSIEYPHTLVLTDLSEARDRDSWKDTPTILDSTKKYQYSKNAPNRVPNRYIDLKQKVKELMFLPSSFKNELINYFEKWGMDEAVSEDKSKDRWLGTLDPINWDPKTGIFLGERGNNGIKHWNTPHTYEDTQFQWGYQGFMTTEWRSAIYEGKLDTTKAAGGTGGGYFNAGQEKYNLWYLAYGGDTNKDRVATQSSTTNAKRSTGSKHIMVGYNSACFVAGTKILLSGGMYKNIEDVNENDTIVSYDVLEKGFYESKVPLNDLQYKNELIKIYLENGKTTTSTFSHPYYVKDKGWAAYKDFEQIDEPTVVKQMGIGDELYYYDNDTNTFNFIKIENIVEKVGKPVRVWNLKGVNNFIANNILVHNKTIKS